MKCCPACGQTLPPPFPEGVVLRAGQRTIFEAILKAGKHGIASERLVAIRYGNDPSGGPENPKNAICSHITHINKLLKKAGKRIEGGRGGAGAFYVLKDISECK